MSLKVSKAVVYSVVGPPAGAISVAKANVYSVVDRPNVAVAKAHAYAVLAPPDGVSISKAVAYAVLDPGGTTEVSKLVGYAVVGSPPDSLVVTKAVGYAVTISPYQKVSKAVAYAVLSAPTDAVAVAKVVAYAVLGPVASAAIEARQLDVRRGDVGVPFPAELPGGAWTPVGGHIEGQHFIEDEGSGVHGVTASGMPADDTARTDVSFDVQILEGIDWVKITIGEQWGFVNIRTGELGDHSADFMLHWVT